MNHRKDVNTDALKYSFWVSLIYVGLGTLALFGAGWKPVIEYELPAFIIATTILVTMPVCFLGFGILYMGGRDAYAQALMVQGIVFLIFWLIIYLARIRKLRKK